ncbi:Bardet-Biedl syndrome 1 protein homolog [Lingula anatina]|uniref:BBSome complex member BBS1 n=1 Tax=Lingula anatina TaxID=7574 RepID=A0A1S3I1L6_LINAN|nr:Bardet-Biedl syndrome 1 protein homolog [Lingula anatina]|eukprot:XP_013391721.1 Bardet-Biedl syndrome 1 protein homolog [Lingula anatina]
MTSQSTTSKDSIDATRDDGKWLSAFYDPVASLYTFSQCITLSDINADGDNKLIIADLGTGSYQMKLKVYKGTNLVSENTLIDLPTGVATFYMDQNEPRTPAVAVASGPYMYVYKNLRPYFKFTLPSLEINPLEQDVWNQVRDERIDVGVLREMLEGMRAEGTSLTVRSLRFIQLQAEDLEAFANQYKHTPLKKQTVITSLGTMKKSLAEEDAISCLVLGTESKQVYILDPEAFTVLSTMNLPSVPVFLNVSGLYDVEFRIIVACRNGNIYMLKRGTKNARSCIELNSQPVGLERMGKNIVVGCMDETLQCYTTKGKKLWTIKLPASITSMENVDHKSKGFKAVMVALSNCEVHIYKDKYLVNIIKTEDIVTGMKFGRFGREDASLIMTTKGGGLIVKILKRTAVFEEKDATAGPPVSQNIKLNVPKKTKLFVDQTMREREHCVSMHRMFQHDLYRLRLDAARSYVKALETSMNPVSTNTTEPLKLSAQVQGIGPTFKLTVNLQNTSISTASFNLLITFQFDDRLYNIHKTYIPVPMLVPGLSYAFETFVDCLSDKGISDTIKVFVLRQGRSVPIITAMISMPVSETMVVV